MLLIRSILSVIAIVVASGLRSCDDCKKIDACTPAFQLLTAGNRAENTALLKKAHCGFDGLPKVCCSDFESRSSLPEAKAIGNIISRTSADDDIETHPNIHLLSGECGDLEGNRIFGGSAASLFEFPWLALITHKVQKILKFDCGGTVINSRYVLTAAHCIKNTQVVSVRIGEYDIGSQTDCTGEGENRECAPKYQDIPVSHAYYHNEYAHNPLVINDIGLLRLARPVDFSMRNAGMICLPITKNLLEMDITSETGTVAGWGMTEKQERSNILLKIEVPIISAITCSDLYNGNRRIIGRQMKNVFCAGELNRDSCKGDSGGPLMIEADYNETYKFVQYGIVSYGPLQCGSEFPGVYTDVRKFMKWILDNIKP